MAHSATHDFLTDLPNRLLLNDRLDRAIALATRYGKKLAVLFLDLDRFKNVNDSLGHAVGDKLLQSVARRLAECTRASDTVSRQGGDEFIVLLSEVSHSEDAARNAQKILTALAAPHAVDAHELHAFASIGISVYPDDGTDAQHLIQCADTAMYHAKEKGRSIYQFFRPDMNVRAVERHTLETSLRRALVQGEFVLNYQPKISLDTGVIAGVEALIRWQHPWRGIVHPAQFVPVAEDCGLIVPIGQWVLGEACGQAKSWLDAGLPFGQVSVNISTLEFRNGKLLNRVRETLRETGLPASCLELEITESVLMQDPEAAAALLHSFSAMGVTLAIDDFGTGYSSLSYLRRFPIDTLKIDQSFVQDIDTDPDDATIVSAVIAMGRSLNQRVIAEGVETPTQLAFLKSHQCSEGQGYLFSHPVTAPRLAALLESGITMSTTG